MTKKICVPASACAIGEIIGWTYPVYHDSGKKYYVDFCSWDPAVGKMRRKKYHVDHIKNKKDRLHYANGVIATLVRKLSGGWNPWAQVKGFRGYTKLEDVLEKYLEHCRKKGTRLQTVRTYTSRVNVFREYLGSLPVPVVYAYQYDVQLVNEFLDWCLIDQDNSPRTRNNYKGWCGSLGEWLVARKYIEENPCDHIQKIPENGKKRQPLTAEMLGKLRKYLERNDRYFLLAVMMEYYTFIRPTELTNLRIRDIDLSGQAVRISGSFSKNRRDGVVGLNPTVIHLMLDLRIFNHSGDEYLFSKDFMPGVKRMRADVFNKRWAVIRRALRWGDEYQFYSLKDSGIRDLANEKGIVVARDQARHTDISTTNKYLGQARSVSEESKNFSGKL